MKTFTRLLEESQRLSVSKIGQKTLQATPLKITRSEVVGNIEAKRAPMQPVAIRLK